MKLKDKKTITIATLSVLIVFGIVLSTVKSPSINSFLGNFGIGDSISKEREAKLVAEQKQYEEDKKVMKNVFSLIPKEASQVVHANFSKVDRDSQWENLLELAPAIIFNEESKSLKINDLDKIKSLTLSFFQGYEYHEGDTQPTESVKSIEQPFAHLMILTTPTENTLNLFSSVTEILDMNNVSVDFLQPKDSELGYVVVYTLPAKYKVLPVIKPYFSGETPLEDNAESFASSVFLEEFDLKDTQPSMYYNFTQTFDTLFAYREGASEKNAAFLDTLREKGLGLDGVEDVVWFGKTKELNSDHSRWEGKFVSGKINPLSIDHKTLDQAIIDQYVISAPENEAPETTDDPGVYMSYGHFSYGLSVVADALNIKTPRGSTGLTEDQISVDDNGETQVDQEPLGSNDEAVIHYAPRDLIGIFTGYDIPHQSKYLTWTLKKDGLVALDVENA